MGDTTARQRPAYKELPDGRALGVYGPDDHLGALNLLTPERTLRAAGLVRTGQVVSLNAPFNYPYPHPAAANRRPATHVIVRQAVANEDYFDDFRPQYSSQWDGFLHVPDHEYNCFYNGNTDESIGIEKWADHGIVGRGVLLDVARWRETVGRPIDWQARDVITVADLEGCAEAHGVEVEEGTVLLVRTGWESGWSSLGFSERSQIKPASFQSPGLDPCQEMVERLWDWGVAAVASDNMALEPYPIHFDEYFLHVPLLVRAGVPMGEFFLLDALAEACAAEQRYEFLVASAPMNVPGGLGSTANALAVL